MNTALMRKRVRKGKGVRNLLCAAPFGPTGKRFLTPFLLPFLLLALASHVSAFTLDEIVQHVNATAESIKDVQASAKVTKFNSAFEETETFVRKFYFQKPHLVRIDHYKLRKGKEVLNYQFILGRDFALQVWPETRFGEFRKLSPEDIDRMTRDRNDPISFFARNLEDIRKDFNIEQVDPPKGAPENSAALVITPANKDVKFDYAKVEMVVDTKTWLPRSIKSIVKGTTEPLDWTLYEFTDIKVNPGLKPETFPDKIPGIRIEVIEKEKPEK